MLKRITSACIIMLATTFSYANHTIININHWKTKEKVPVFFDHSSSVPMLQLTLIFKVGSYYDGTHDGLSTLTSQLLTEGSQQYSAATISDALSRAGASFTADSNKEYTTITLKSLTSKDYLQKSIRLFNRILTTPTFSETAMQRVKQQMLTELHLQMQNPNTFAIQQLFSQLYRNTPLAHNVLGNPQSLATISQQDIKKFYHRYYVKKNLAVILVGDVTTSQAHSITQQLLAGLCVGKQAAPIKPVTAQANTKAHVYTFPSNQTTILRAALVPVDSHNRYPLIVGNYIFGGNGLTSVLGTVLRDKHSLSYSATSQFIPMQNQDIWLMSLQAKNSKATLARKLSIDTLTRYTTQGPDQKQLSAAKNFLINSLPLNFTSNAQISTAIARLYLNHLPLDYYDHFKQNIEKTKRGAIQKAFQQFIPAKSIITVVVGGQHA